MNGSGSYSDIDYRLRKDGTGNIMKVSDSDSINQSIKTILGTYPGERIMNPMFGCRLRELLFQPIGSGTAQKMVYEIESVLEREEHRISVSDITINPDYDSNLYEVTITYSWRGSNRQGEFNTRIRSLS